MRSSVRLPAAVAWVTNADTLVPDGSSNGSDTVVPSPVHRSRGTGATGAG